MNNNADPAELQKFGDRAYHWWDPNSEFRPLHEINPLRLNWICQRAEINAQRVVDVGCGGGILTEAMAACGALASGIDLSEKALSVARLHALESQYQIDYQLCSAEQFASENPSAFAVVTCMEMLEHVPDPASIVQACANLVRPGGDVFLSTLNRTPKAYLFAIVAGEYMLKLLPKGTHDHARFIKPAELAYYCRIAGLDVIDLTGLHYNPLSRTYSLGPGTDVNYLVHARRPT